MRKMGPVRSKEGASRENMSVEARDDSVQISGPDGRGGRRTSVRAVRAIVTIHGHRRFRQGNGPRLGLSNPPNGKSPREGRGRRAAA